MGRKTGTRWRYRNPPPHGTVVVLTMRRQNRIEVLLRFGNTCVYCGQAVDKITIDHGRPQSRGGLTLPENLLPACLGCNQRKGCRSVTEFARSCPSEAPIHEILKRHPHQWA